LPDQRLIVPSAVAVALIKQQHKLIHLGKIALEKLLDRYYFISKLPTLCTQVITRCITCTQSSASQGPRTSSGIQTTGTMPFEVWKWTSQRSSPVKVTSTSLFLSEPSQGGSKLTPPTQKKHEK
jgi:hypothetical protein